jgi:hypothetical protein
METQKEIVSELQRLQRTSRATLPFTIVGLVTVVIALYFSAVQLARLRSEVRETTDSLEEAAKRKIALEAETKATQAQLTQAKTELDGLLQKLNAIKSTALPTADTQVLDTAINQALQIKEAVTTADTRLSAVATVNPQLQQLVERLFSEKPSERANAYNILTSQFRRDPDAVSALLNYAWQHTDNANGIYNTVVTLKDLSRAVTQPRKDDINRFLDEAEKQGGKTKQQSDATRKWLETKR